MVKVLNRNLSNSHSEFLCSRNLIISQANTEECKTVSELIHICLYQEMFLQETAKIFTLATPVK